jgi:hypothetical protein
MKINYLLFGFTILVLACKKDSARVFNITIDQQKAYCGNLDEYLNSMAALRNNDMVSSGWTITNCSGQQSMAKGFGRNFSRFCGISYQEHIRVFDPRKSNRKQ